MTWLRTVTLVGGLALVGLLIYLYLVFGAFLPWRERQEAGRLAEVLGVGEGSTIAEIGAGSGRFTEVLARRVGPSGRVYSTEIDDANLDAIRKRIQAAGLGNVTVIEADEAATNLPEGCCEAIFLRNVYHHIGDPDAFAASLRRAVKAGGRLAIIDFEPASMPFHGSRPEGASERREGHGVSRAHAVREMNAAGFTLDREVADWAGPLWLLVFRLPTSDVRPSTSDLRRSTAGVRSPSLDVRRYRLLVVVCDLLREIPLVATGVSGCAGLQPCPRYSSSPAICCERYRS